MNFCQISLFLPLFENSLTHEFRAVNSLFPEIKQNVLKGDEGITSSDMKLFFIFSSFLGACHSILKIGFGK